jgi:ribose/xylose/arabinose/galactoside ABC-type transport system permease subunit
MEELLFFWLAQRARSYVFDVTRLFCVPFGVASEGLFLQQHVLVNVLRDFFIVPLEALQLLLVILWQGFLQ